MFCIVKSPVFWLLDGFLSIMLGLGALAKRSVESENGAEMTVINSKYNQSIFDRTANEWCNQFSGRVRK